MAANHAGCLAVRLRVRRSTRDKVLKRTNCNPESFVGIFGKASFVSCTKSLAVNGQSDGGRLIRYLVFFVLNVKHIRVYKVSCIVIK